MIQNKHAHSDTHPHMHIHTLFSQKEQGFQESKLLWTEDFEKTPAKKSEKRKKSGETACI